LRRRLSSLGVRRAPATVAQVLDVAGGHGKLAFELLNLHGVGATVVDPRPLQLRRCQQLWGRGLWHKTGSRVHVAEPPPHRPRSESALLPEHLRLFFDAHLWEQAGKEKEEAAAAAAAGVVREKPPRRGTAICNRGSGLEPPPAPHGAAR
jgi:hypothetical protein